MIADIIIQRLRAKGLQVDDYRRTLPRRPTSWRSRSVSSIRRIAVHHDAVDVSQGYNPLARYTAEANYHAYIKVWDKNDDGTPVYGDGIMYHIKIAADGHVYITRDFEDITWQVGRPNGTALGVCCDGNFIGSNEPFQEQVRSLALVLDVLTHQCPEFPASQPDVWGHKEFVQFGGLGTECPGNLLPSVQSFRASGNIPNGFAYYNQGTSIQPAPVSVPPVPQPTGQANGQVNVTVISNPPPPPAAPNTFIVRVSNDFDGLAVRLGTPGTGVIIGQYYKGTDHEVYSGTETDTQGRQWYRLVQKYVDGRSLFIASWAVSRV